jgi:hypothetical protein
MARRMTRTSVAVAVLLSLCACSTSSPPATTSPPGAPIPPPLPQFAVSSVYDLGASVPGAAGSALATITALTDEPDDPAAFVLAAMIAQLPDGAIKDALAAAEPVLAAYLDDRLLQWAPDFVGTLVALGSDLAQAAQAVGTDDTVAITDGGATASHEIDGLRYVLDGVTYDLPFQSNGIAPVVVPAIDVAFGDGALALADHAIPLPYGAMLQLTLDHAIVPSVDPGADGLLGVLADAVDCTAVGSAVAKTVHASGDAAELAAVCSAALSATANAVYGDLQALDTETLTLDVVGVAVAPVDEDGEVDTLYDGTWTGTVTFGSAGTTPLAAGSFTGQRE